jgi:hypothetical protein
MTTLRNNEYLTIQEPAVMYPPHSLTLTPQTQFFFLNRNSTQVLMHEFNNSSTSLFIGACACVLYCACYVCKITEFVGPPHKYKCVLIERVGTWQHLTTPVYADARLNVVRIGKNSDNVKVDSPPHS